MHKLIPNIISLTITIITIMEKRISIYCLSHIIKIFNQNKMKDIKLSNHLGTHKDMNQNNKVRKPYLWSNQSKMYRLINLINQTHIHSNIRLSLSLKIDNSRLKIYHQVGFNKGIRYNIASIMIYAGKSVENSM